MKRWGRDDPYHNQLELGPPSSERIVATSATERTGRMRLGMRWPFQVLGLLITVAAAFAFVVPHRATPGPPTNTVDQYDSSHVMHLSWHQGLTTPATTPTLWWIDTPTNQRVQVTVAPGQTPLDALTRALAAQGWQATYP